MWLSREKGEIGGGDATEYVLQKFHTSSGDTLADFQTLNITPSIEILEQMKILYLNRRMGYWNWNSNDKIQ